MAFSVYVGDTSEELAGVRRLLVDQLQQAGLQPITLADSRRQDTADLQDRVRGKIAFTQAFITVLAYRRGWEPDSLGGRSLAEAEYDAARELGKTIAVLVPRPESELAAQLRQRAVGQSPTYREKQRTFMQQVERESRVYWFSDEADFSEQVAGLLSAWSSAARSTAAPPQPTGWFQRWWQGMFSLDTLAEQIVEQIADRLAAQQQRDQTQLAQQAMQYQEVLRLKPGELVFGKPLTSSQFQSDIFVIMPFASDFDPVYRDVLKPLVESLKLRCVRGDEFASRRGSIIEEVWAALNNCRLVIADITGGNDNVFYELGIAHTLNKPAIILTQAQNPESVPFDIRHLRYIQYKNTDEGLIRLRADLESALTWLLSDLEESWG